MPIQLIFYFFDIFFIDSWEKVFFAITTPCRSIANPLSQTPFRFPPDTRAKKQPDGLSGCCTLIRPFLLFTRKYLRQSNAKSKITVLQDR